MVPAGGASGGVGHVDALVREYLLFRGFSAACREFDAAAAADAAPPGAPPRRVAEELMGACARRDAQALLTLWRFLERRLFGRLDERLGGAARTLWDALRRHFMARCAVAGDGTTLRGFLETALAPEAGSAPEWAPWFALPYVKDPARDARFRAAFTRPWAEALATDLTNFLAEVFGAVRPPALLRFGMERQRRRTLELELEAMRSEVTRLRSLLELSGSGGGGGPREAQPVVGMQDGGQAGAQAVAATRTQSVQPSAAARRIADAATAAPAGMVEGPAPSDQRALSSEAAPAERHRTRIVSFDGTDERTSSVPAPSLRASPVTIPSSHWLADGDSPRATEDAPLPLASSIDTLDLDAGRTPSPRMAAALRGAADSFDAVAPGSGEVAASASDDDDAPMSALWPLQRHDSSDVTLPVLEGAAAAPPLPLPPVEFRTAHCFEGHSKAVRRCRLSGGGAAAASASADGSARVWTVDSSTGATTMDRNATIYCGAEVLSLAWESAGDRLLLLGTASSQVKAWNADARRVVGDISVDASTPYVCDLHLSPSSAEPVFVSAACSEPAPIAGAAARRRGVVTVWSATTFKPLHTLPMGNSAPGVSSVRLSGDDGRLAAVGADDGTVRLFDVNTRALVASLDCAAAGAAPGDAAACVRFDGGNQAAYVLTASGMLLEWDLRRAGSDARGGVSASASVAQHGCALGERVPEFALASGVGDAPAALLTSLNETATLVDVRTGGARGAIDGHAGGASSVGWHRSGLTLSATGEGRVLISVPNRV